MLWLFIFTDPIIFVFSYWDRRRCWRSVVIQPIHSLSWWLYYDRIVLLLYDNEPHKSKSNVPDSNDGWKIDCDWKSRQFCAFSLWPTDSIQMRRDKSLSFTSIHVCNRRCLNLISMAPFPMWSIDCMLCSDHSSKSKELINSLTISIGDTHPFIGNVHSSFTIAAAYCQFSAFFFACNFRKCYALCKVNNFNWVYHLFPDFSYRFGQPVVSKLHT